ncbi:hypothetical protein [uncultured Pseudacidovorax sp.]|uniref:hypothetical protein n=1 Tax=uncultured Pseudacidovorax sp. TaxID=679313 RepID=UPI0025DB6476|nr:hypothetical protein [uncultured Pseudacidovorax sp.]
MLLMTACGGCSVTARAEQVSDTSSPYSASARLDFRVDVGKFVYLRVGPAGVGLATVAFNVSATIPAGSVAATNGNNKSVSWSAAVPGFGVMASNNVLPVEVASNAGTVSLQASVISPLSSGSASIAMNGISIVLDNAGLTAPPVPASGSGAAVTVAGTAFSNLVTQRAANWTFGLAMPGLPAAGTYSGQLGFTASVP